MIDIDKLRRCIFLITLCSYLLMIHFQLSRLWRNTVLKDISKYNQVCWRWSNKLCSKTKLNKLQLLPPGFPCTKLDTFIALCFYMKENNIVLQLTCLSLSFGFEYICLSIMNWLYGMILLCYWRPNCELKENPLDSYS